MKKLLLIGFGVFIFSIIGFIVLSPVLGINFINVSDEKSQLSQSQLNDNEKIQQLLEESKSNITYVDDTLSCPDGYTKKDNLCYKVLDSFTQDVVEVTPRQLISNPNNYDGMNVVVSGIFTTKEPIFVSTHQFCTAEFDPVKKPGYAYYDSPSNFYISDPGDYNPNASPHIISITIIHDGVIINDIPKTIDESRQTNFAKIGTTLQEGQPIQFNAVVKSGIAFDRANTSCSEVFRDSLILIVEPSDLGMTVYSSDDRLGDIQTKLSLFNLFG